MRGGVEGGAGGGWDNHSPFVHCRGQDPFQVSWCPGILTLARPACLLRQALWVGGLVPIGNGLDIINPANHQPLPARCRGGESPEPGLPQKAPASLFFFL